jgi:hypothetical protein
VVSDRSWGETSQLRAGFTRLSSWPEMAPQCHKRDTSGPFRPRNKPANVQWLASPKGSSGVGRLHRRRRLLNWGQSGGAKPRADSGEGLLGRASQELWPKESGRLVVEGIRSREDVPNFEYYFKG